MTERLDFATDGRRWPHREASRFVEAAGLLWHIQEFGSSGGAHRPLVLLVHGTAAATHSWRGLAPLLAHDYTVLACDLPGHGFTGRQSNKPNSLSNMASALGQLLSKLAVTPTCAIGHSAGAAILIRMASHGLLPAHAQLIGLNAALVPYAGFPGRLMMPLARALAANPLLARLCTWRAGDRAAVARVLASTGSTIDTAGVDLYAQLFRNPGHVSAAMDMMAHWDLSGIARDVEGLQRRIFLVACGGDQAVRSDDAFQIRDRAPAVTVEFIRGLGHLAHEERPDLIAARLTSLIKDHAGSQAA
jgi:magnesium chelatase accessory protein